MKLSHSKTASRRAHHRAGMPRIVATPSGVRLRHFMDTATGMYRGKQIIAVATKAVSVAPKSKKATRAKKSLSVKEGKKKE